MMTSAQQQITDMGTQCAHCAGRSFRRSRLQSKDILPLLLMRYPVRCLSCSQRQAVNMLVAQRAMPSTMKQVRASRGAESWSGWNATQDPAKATVPGTVGGGSFTAIPMSAPVIMPELRGVTLKHVSTNPGNERI